MTSFHVYAQYPLLLLNSLSQTYTFTVDGPELYNIVSLTLLVTSLLPDLISVIHCTSDP